MAITINGSGTITGISAGGLPDGSVTAADIESTLDLSSKTVTLPAGTGGKVLQVVQTYSSSSYSTTSSGWTDAPAYAVSITPSSSSSKILVMYNIWAIQYTQNHHLAYDIKQTIGGTSVRLGESYGLGTVYTQNVSEWGTNVHAVILASPATTSAVTYTPQFNNYNGSSTGTTFGNSGRGGVCIAMEIAG